MNSSESILQQRRKEGKVLKIFLACSLIGSLAFHAGAMMLRVGNLWNPLPKLEEEEETEIIVENIPEEQPIEENVLEPPPELEAPQEVAFTPDVPPPLAPETQAPVPLGEDAPSKEPPSPTNDPVSPITSSTGDTQVSKSGTGPITSPEGTGSGFGNAKQPTGFVPSGKPEGKPGGKPEGTATRSTTPPPPAPVKPARRPNLTCLECPKPKYRGSEASPRVDLEVQPDGSVKVRLRKSSGNAETDRETLETMSKWRFDPKTVPEGGVRKRVRVTYEEEGSKFQRQNEQRRQQETERRRIAEQEQQRREAERYSPPPATAGTETPTKPAIAAPVEQPAPAVERPAPTPVEAAPPPAPVETAPPPPEPVYEAPPPEPVYEAPPPAPEPAPEPVPVEPPAPVEAAPVPPGQ